MFCDLFVSRYHKDIHVVIILAISCGSLSTNTRMSGMESRRHLFAKLKHVPISEIPNFCLNFSFILATNYIQHKRIYITDVIPVFSLIRSADHATPSIR
jgi:hypothetical protein